MGQGSHAAGGGAPGWRPCPFGLVGAGSGVGVGRRGERKAPVSSQYSLDQDLAVPLQQIRHVPEKRRHLQHH